MSPRQLPTTFRPRWGRRVAYAMAVLIVVSFATAAPLLPSGPNGYGVGDRIGILLLGLAIAAFLHRLGSLRIEADERGLTVVNVVRRRRLDWPEVLGVRLAEGQPWVVLDLSDGTSLPAMGVQGSDGAYAREQALDLARLVASRTRLAGPSPDDRSWGQLG